jgi:phytanoyl-CoA hydroxylase
MAVDASTPERDYTIAAPDGGDFSIPVDVDEATDPYLALRDGAAFRAYFEENGYVVARGLVPAGLCDAARKAFAAEVKPYGKHIYRQATAVPERNRFTEHGHVLNSILNIQDLARSDFPHFRAAGLAVITNEGLQRAFRTLAGDDVAVVQSMYFDGNPTTWAHQDTYYLDSADLGRMTGAWVALEDIRPGAGRFYVYPRSHLIDMEKNGGDFDIAFNHERYKQLVIDVVRTHGLRCHAPAMRKGDVLFWGSKTIHGSLVTTEGRCSRASITAHAIPGSRPFVQFQSREKRLSLQRIDGVAIHCPKDQNRLANRAVLVIETTFPGLFQAAKRLAIKLVTR